MKIKTSITLSKEALQALDELSGHYHSRSDLIEKAIWAFLATLERKHQDVADLEILNRCADGLNQEAEDVLEFQSLNPMPPAATGLG
jgi:metal-responsive CopG/Arc/MetJ family transcriptional regulator